MNSNLVKVGIITISSIIVLGVILVSLVILPQLMNPVIEPEGDASTYGKGLSSKMVEKESNILAMLIVGNSSEIVYPELGYAAFVATDNGELNVTSFFIDDSAGPYNIITYFENFTASVSEVETMNQALYDGINTTILSNDDLATIEASIGFGIDILYKDGTFVQLFTLQDEKGHIVYLNGTYTGSLDPDSLPFGFGNDIQRNTNMFDGVLLEPSSALDGLVTAMNAVFQAHLG
ncbi:MAG: hypothetical protein ACFFC7_10295 [Candidatus Hermodarchaeota archaeon]